MVDWTILSPTFLTAIVQWAGAAMTALTAGLGRSSKDTEGRELQ